MFSQAIQNRQYEENFSEGYAIGLVEGKRSAIKQILAIRFPGEAFPPLGVIAPEDLDSAACSHLSMHKPRRSPAAIQAAARAC